MSLLKKTLCEFANSAHANSSASLHYSTQAVAAVRNVKRFTSCMTEDDFFFLWKNLPDTGCIE